MRMDKQGKGSSNAVDEEEKRQVRAMDGRVRLQGTKRKHERESKCLNNAAQPATPQ